MEVKKAVQIAKAYVADIFESENPENIGLEEVSFDEAEAEWKITVGFSRAWNYRRLGIGETLSPRPRPERQYKIVSVSNENEMVMSVKIRDDVPQSVD